MPNEKIIRYYKLCTVRIGERKHIIDGIKNTIAPLVTKKDIETYFRNQDGYLVPREIVVGGSRQPIILI